MKKKYIKVKDLTMAYLEEGQGDPIVFLHGNPSSSYEWRNVIPYLTRLGRCIAPDLIGMGDSDKLAVSGPSSYRFVEHREYLDAFFDAMNIRQNVTLVLHDWGSALGFDWANRHREAIKQIAYMEAFVAPIDSWDDLPPEAVKFFETMYSAVGEKMVLEENFIIEKELPTCMLRKLSEEEMNVYRKPYLKPGESRRPTLTWRREVPIAGKPSDVCQIIQDYGKWLASSAVPKLFIEAIPGVMFEAHRKFALSWSNQLHVKIKGGHFVQEDSPDEVGEAIASWMRLTANYDESKSESAQKTQYYDLTAKVTEKTVVFPGDPEFKSEELCSLEKGSLYRLCHMHFGNHTGTHIDFSAHVIKGGKTSSDFSIESLMGAGLIIEVPEVQKSITKKFVADQPILVNDFVFFKTSNSKLAKQGKFNDKYVYIEPEAAEELLKKGVKIVGIDYLSVDQYGAANFPVHQLLLSKNVLIVEGLELNNAPIGRCKIFIIPVNINEMDGLPARVIAQRYC